MACILHIIDDFERLLTKSGRYIKGFGGTMTKPVKKDTIVWKWHDYNGKENSFKILNLYYAPKRKVRLLSPSIGQKNQRKQSQVKEHDVKQ